MQLSQAELKAIQADLSQTVVLGAGPQPNYSAAYTLTLKYLTKADPNATGANADVLHWLAIAQQVNSGATTAPAIAIRADNAAASALQLGKQITLFGPEEQAASNTIARSFFCAILVNGTVPTFQHIMQIDAQSGLGSLGLSQDAWAGAVPDLIASSPLVGFNTDNFYDTLTPAEQNEANVIHGIAADLTADEIIGLGLKLSQTTIDKIIQTDAALDTQQPFLAVFETASGAITSGGTALIEADNIAKSLSMLAINVRSGIANTESDLEALFGQNPGISKTTSVTDAGPDIDLNLSNLLKPFFNIYISDQRGAAPTTVSGDALINEDVTFLSDAGTATIDNAASYTGTVFGFVPGDTIDLANVGTTTGAAMSAGNTLALQGSSGNICNLHFNPKDSFAKDNLLIGGDNNGGTLLVNASDAMAIGTQPVALPSLAAGEDFAYDPVSSTLFTIRAVLAAGGAGGLIVGNSTDVFSFGGKSNGFIIDASNAGLDPATIISLKQGEADHQGSYSLIANYADGSSLTGISGTNGSYGYEDYSGLNQTGTLTEIYAQANANSTLDISAFPFHGSVNIGYDNNPNYFIYFNGVNATVKVTEQQFDGGLTVGNFVKGDTIDIVAPVGSGYTLSAQGNAIEEYDDEQTSGWDFFGIRPSVAQSNESGYDLLAPVLLEYSAGQYQFAGTLGDTDDSPRFLQQSNGAGGVSITAPGVTLLPGGQPGHLENIASGNHMLDLTDNLRSSKALPPASMPENLAVSESLRQLAKGQGATVISRSTGVAMGGAEEVRFGSGMQPYKLELFRQFVAAGFSELPTPMGSACVWGGHVETGFDHVPLIAAQALHNAICAA
jgi:hypothetical protein